MAQKDRIDQIKRLMIDERSVTVSALSRNFAVTEETIRRDLEKLEKKGFLTRTYGGAILNAEFINQYSIHFSRRSKINWEAKKSIAEKACSILTTENIIGVDSSSTVMEFIRIIKGDSSRTLFTNSVSALLECLQADINVLSTGGYLNKSSLSLQGVGAQNTIENYHLDIAFISCKAIEIGKGIFDTNEYEAAIKKSLVEQSKTVALLIDHTKFDRNSFVKVLDFSQINYIVTDKKPADQWESFCKINDIKLVY